MKTEECVREIRPLGFVIEFRPESAISAVSPDMDRYGPSQRESARFGANWPEFALRRREL